MRENRPWPIVRWFGLSAAAVCLTVAAGQAADPGTTALQIELPGDPSVPVIKLVEVVGEVDGDDHPSITVFPDGRVVRHRAAFMAEPGDYIAQISPLEVDDLVRSLIGKGMLSFDEKQVRLARDTAEKSDGTLRYVSDPSLFQLEIRLERYQPAGALRPQANVFKAIDWSGLRADAKWFSAVTEIRNLSTVVRELNDLSERVEREARAAAE